METAAQVLPNETVNMSAINGHDSGAIMMSSSHMYVGQSLESNEKEHGDATDENITVVTNNNAEGDVRQQLLRQLEYYFSSENLAQDTYLISQMDAQQYVPIWTIASFNGVKKLTNDINLITEVFESSPVVQVDEKREKVRPVLTGRTFVLIIREIPDDTTAEEVEELFNDVDCPRFTSVEFAASNCWYISFTNEPEAQQAYRHLREKVKTFKGNPIMARIKLKHHMGSQSSHGNGASFKSPPTTQHSSSASSSSSQPATSEPNQVEYVNLPSPISNSVFLPEQYSQAISGGQQPPFIAAIAVPQQNQAPMLPQHTTHNGQWPNMFHHDPLITNGYAQANSYFIGAAQQRAMFMQNGGAMQYSNRNAMYNDVHNVRNEQSPNDQSHIPNQEISGPQYLPAVPIKNGGRIMPAIPQNAHAHIYHQAYSIKSDYYIANGDAPRYHHKRMADAGHPLRYSATRSHYNSTGRMQSNEHKHKYYNGAGGGGGGGGGYNHGDVNANNNNRRYNEPSKPTLGETARFTSVPPKQRKGRREVTQRPQAPVIPRSNNSPVNSPVATSRDQSSLSLDSFPPLPTNTVNTNTVEIVSSIQSPNHDTLTHVSALAHQQSLLSFDNRVLLQEPYRSIEDDFVQISANEIPPSNHTSSQNEPIIQQAGENFPFYDLPSKTCPVVMPTSTVLPPSGVEEDERLTFVNEETNQSNSSSICVIVNGSNPEANSDAGSDDCDSDKKPTYAQMLQKINKMSVKQSSDGNSTSSGDDAPEAQADGQSDPQTDEEEWKEVNKKTHHKPAAEESRPAHGGGRGRIGRGGFKGRGGGRGGRFARSRRPSNNNNNLNNNNNNNTIKNNIHNSMTNLNNNKSEVRERR